jgi:hypothetical protein
MAAREWLALAGRLPSRHDALLAALPVTVLGSSLVGAPFLSDPLALGVASLASAAVAADCLFVHPPSSA